uniref:hypothetical protein n=1 Tax=uncultured Sphingomonas sp. TaxID=158754 RepID=UPI0025F9CCE9|nr:hypothetical protein [uncultured Sphingomonas sp.]
MKTTRYFEQQVIRKRPYLQRDWIAAVLEQSLARSEQPDGRIRLWGRVEREDGKRYILRVVTLDDGETVHNAFFDRDFKEAKA